jgi:hypothetical protein
MTCDQLHEIADEVAVGMVTGTERAAALFHLEQCADCREMVASLSVTADLVLLAAPASPPPAGFEARVLGRIEDLGEQARVPTRTRRRRWLRPVLVAAALLAVLVVTLVPDGRGESVSAAPMRTGDGTVVGSAHLSNEDPTSIIVNVTDWQKTGGGAPQPYRIAVERRDATRQFITLGPQPDYSWEISVLSPASEIFGVALVDNNGTVLCSGLFDAPS